MASTQAGVAPHGDAPLLPGVASALLLWGLVAILLGPNVLRLVTQWRSDPNYSHGALVLPISAFLAFRAFRAARPAPHRDELLGMAGVAAGLVLHLWNLVLDINLLEFVAWVFLFRGLAVVIGGRAWANRFWFPILFLFFLFPLPAWLTGRLANFLQDAVSQLAGVVLPLLFDVSRQGTTFTIRGIAEPLSVGQECSGLRQSFVFWMLACLVGYGSGRRGVGLLLLLSALPIAIVCNATRVVFMALGMAWFSGDWTTGLLHHVPVLFTLPLGLLLMLVIVKIHARTLGRLGW